jgi:hypothetical protein
VQLYCAAAGTLTLSCVVVALSTLSLTPSIVTVFPARVAAKLHPAIVPLPPGEKAAGEAPVT